MAAKPKAAAKQASPPVCPRPGALYLIDGSNYIFRAYFALVKSTRPDQSTYLSTSKGLPTGALLVFSNMLMKLYLEHRPKYATVVFDSAARTFRDEMYPQYKETRRQPPDDLKPQFPYFPRIIDAFNIPMLRVGGVEADDVIATLAVQAQKKGMEVVIWSGDKDLLQLCGNGIYQVDTLRDVEYTPEAVQEKFGVSPEKLGDVLALMGDTSDNIPGVSGIGPGWAAKLVNQYGSLEGALTAAERGEIKGKIGETLRNATERENAILSRKLVALKTDVTDLPEMAALARREFDKKKLTALFHELEFGKLEQRVAGTFFLDRDRYETVLDPDHLARVLAAARAAGEFAVDTETTSTDAARAEIIGISIAFDGSPPAYIPIGHRYLGAPAQLPLKTVTGALKPLLEDPTIGKYAQNHKYELVIFRRQGVELSGVRADPMIASYLIDPSRSSHGLDALTADHLGHEMITYAQLCGTGRDAKPIETCDVRDVTRYAAEDAEATLLLGKLLYPRVCEAGMKSLLEDIELPLARILADMETLGVLVDREHLSRLSDSTGKQLHELEQKIHALAGYPINVNSPKQLQELLFEKLHLQSGRRTKTGASTDADVLEDLQSEHPIIPLILEFREISKLKGTYIDALPKLCDDGGRIHTSYNQAVAATGRLSSSDPNLQNIPIRSELGRKIRRAFIAPRGQMLVSVDYSQIELRVLAHLSEDPLLLQSFERDEDIHARTAAEVFGVEPHTVTSEMRRIAKAINYGLSYGQTDFGLSRVLRIPREDAHRYIERYFTRYAKLREYMEASIAEARRTGVSTTLLGRRRPLPGINAKRYNERAYAERIARNTPIQGAAADILKIAMIRVDKRLRGEKWAATMILTVHDELVFEVPADKAQTLAEMASTEMESAMKLRVPLKVDVGIGPNWDEAKAWAPARSARDQVAMRIFLDTADHRVARQLWSWGSFSGVTTNPILLARAGMTVEDAMAELGRATSGDLFAQAVGTTAAALADEGARLAQLVPGRMIVKIPTTAIGLEAMRLLAARNVLVAATAIFHASQAVLAARAGATWVIPFWHRIAEAGGDPSREVADSANFLERMLSSGLRARVLCASLRSAEEAVAALRAGAAGITVGPDVAEALLAHPGTKAVAQEFDQASKVQRDE